ncbi:hypothetical protein [Variovorax sp. IB41]|uniref:hypothetical protein n=1 Tax=Variovorax sp. IB41 TaxID=2779370 RepID=UPI0018E8FB06|nr:hypothetical protein [Variovorax sp. IB41]MBJ2154575.1 hypothetical protein [Variovorax sp. IB41]
MLLHEIWGDQDNKKIVGKPDSIYVALTEPYELRYFIESILDEAGKVHTDENRQAVLDAVDSYSGKAPVARAALRMHVLAAVKWPQKKPTP